MWNLWTKNMNKLTDKVEILHLGQSDPALKKIQKNFFSVATFMAQISPKYFHTQEVEDHVTFNSIASIELVPKLYQK